MNRLKTSTIIFIIFFSLAIGCTNSQPRKIQRYHTCKIEKKWIYKIVKVTSGNTLLLAEIPEHILNNVDQTCVDDINDAIEEGNSFADITNDINKVMGLNKFNF